MSTVSNQLPPEASPLEIPIVPSRDLKYQQEINYLADDIRHEKGDEFCEKLWAEIERMMDSRDIRDRDDVEDLSLKDIMVHISEKMAIEQLNS